MQCDLRPHLSRGTDEGMREYASDADQKYTHTYSNYYLLYYYAK